MKLAREIPASYQGKTYSLRSESAGSEAYYVAISEAADALLVSWPEAKSLLATTQKLSKNKRVLRKLARSPETSAEASLVKTLQETFTEYTPGVESHLRTLRGIKRWDRTLSTSAEQYHLSMLEIELTNRLNTGRFRACKTKFAFLPHCLRDLTATCKAAERDIDYVCKGCSDDCNVNRSSRILRLHGIKPYIWMTADLRGLFRKLTKEGSSIGVLGIACIPELVNGMRMCETYDVPVVGLPLDANRCRRWWGEFFWNTANMDRLKSLVTD